MHNLFIVGAPRSGTSLAAGLFRLADCRFGGKLESPDSRNRHGYFETKEINAVNEQLLKSVTRELPHSWHRLKRFGLDWAWPFIFPRYTWEGIRVLSHIPPERSIPPPDEKSASIIKRITDSQPFCLKDPRFCYLLDHWRQQAPPSKSICVFRDPYVCAQSMINWPWPISPRNALRSWMCMYHYVLQHFAKKGEWFFVHYDQLFNEETWDALEAFSGAEVDRSFPDKTANRSTPVQTKPIRGLEPLYQELCDRANYIPKSIG